ncbi:N-acetylmuramic acid 6-phosphate etherase [Deinococcus rufus]|uniref:N-acetylmuramic acid 6-phosphate etherase n=1 Tax=Deinococcus rufus TaxID=2136097 RepID=A0ABV7ZAF8_9DEIO
MTTAPRRPHEPGDPVTLDARRTEAVHPGHADLDQLPLPALVQVFVDDQQDAVRAVQAAAGVLEDVVAAALPRLRAGGRLIYAGAGTSGRLGVLDATELTPTFSWPPERAVPLIAGGMEAVRHAVEGAEDDREAGAADVRAVCPGTDDVLLAVAASGTTPYVLGAVHAARAAGALTVGIANNPGTPLLDAPHLAVLLDTGPEVISGSTRLKAGTAQKIALNTISSALMVQLGKVYGNLMVDMRASNDKLQGRAVRMVRHATGADDDAARTALAQADGHVKTAIVMLMLHVDVAQAAARLTAAGGHARLALNAP